MIPDDIILESADGRAVLSLLGATLLSYTPTGGEDLLWVSPLASRVEGKAIRGGIPVCWPWFAKDPERPNAPSHGLVRHRIWSVEEQEASRVLVSISHPGDEHAPAFRLTLEARLGKGLEVSLTHHNLSDHPFACTGALHSYLRARPDQSEIRGLGGCSAFDKVTQRETTATDPMRIASKTDLIVTAPAPVSLADSKRVIHLERTDAPDVVIWNPADDRPGDVPPGGEEEFICVEAATIRSPWIIEANSSRRLRMRLWASL